MERNEELMQAFASELKDRRGRKRLSQEGLAHKAGVNRSYLAKLETVQNQPSLIAMFHIAKALDCTLLELLDAVLKRYHKSQTIRRNPGKPYGKA